LIKRFILDRYILRELLGPFFFGIAAFTCILAGSSVLFYLVGDALRYGIPFGQMMQLFVYKLPSVIVFTFPMSTLLATILAFGRLSSDLEILALRASGIGFERIIIPVAAFGLIVSLITIGFNENIVPQATFSSQQLMRQYTEKKDPNIKQHINLTEYDTEGNPLRITHIQKVDNGVLINATVAEYEKGQLIRVMSAKTGRWVSNTGWEFNDGVMHHFSIENPYNLYVIHFKKEIIDIPIDTSSEDKPKDPDAMNARELKEKIQFQKRTGENPIHNLMKYHMKFSVPFASLIFSILGAAVGVRPHRSSSALGLGLSIVIILIYYILLSTGMALGISHLLPPILGAWLPNIVVGVIGLLLLKQVAF